MWLLKSKNVYYLASDRKVGQSLLWGNAVGLPYKNPYSSPWIPPSPSSSCVTCLHQSPFSSHLQFLFSRSFFQCSIWVTLQMVQFLTDIKSWRNSVCRMSKDQTTHEPVLCKIPPVPILGHLVPTLEPNGMIFPYLQALTLARPWNRLLPFMCLLS